MGTRTYTDEHRPTRTALRHGPTRTTRKATGKRNREDYQAPSVRLPICLCCFPSVFVRVSPPVLARVLTPQGTGSPEARTTRKVTGKRNREDYQAPSVWLPICLCCFPSVFVRDSPCACPCFVAVRLFFFPEVLTS